MAANLSANIYTFLSVLSILFQFGLVVGMPWGNLAMGGKYPGRFPRHMRIGAMVQILVLAFLAMIVLTKAGIVFPAWFTLSETLIWVVVGISGVSVVLNLITPSKWERRLWAPVTIMMLISSMIVAFYEV